MNLFKWNKYLLISLLLVGLAIYAPGSPSQPDIRSLYFEVISTQDKLPNSVIRCIDQDSIGFLWFGSNDGLFRYDGLNYQIFRNIPNDPASLSFNYVVDMNLDREGNPWVLNYTSLDKLNVRNGRFTHYHPQRTGGQPIDLGAVYQIAISPKENVFVTSVRHGLLIKAQNDSVIRLLDAQHHFPEITANLEAIVWHNNCLYVGKKHEGLFKITLSDDERSIARVEKIAASPHAETFSILIDHANRLWAGTSDGIILHDLTNGKTQHFRYLPQQNTFLPDREVLSLLIDDRDNLWIGTRENGLSIAAIADIMRDGEQARAMKYQTGTSEGSLTNRCINEIFRDQSGNFWLGTYSGGLHFVNEYRNKIHTLKYDPGHPESTSHQKIWGITQARDGNLWLGTDGGGIDVWNPRLGIINRIKHQPDGKGLSDNAVLCALTGSDGKLWFGTYRGGINRIDPATGKIKVYNEIPAYIKGDYAYDIRAIYEDSKKQIWVGTNWKGVCRYDRENDRFSNVGELGSLDVRSIIESKNGGYWFGTHSRGLIWYDPLTKSRKNFTSIPGNSNSLPSNDVYFLKEDKDGKLWIGTQYGGLSCLDQNDWSFTNYGVEDGLASNTILSILEDSNGLFWLTTNEGISRFDPTSKTFINYDQTNGVLPGEFLNNSCIDAMDGTFYFGGSNGLNFFKPEFIQPSKVIPRVVFTHLKIFNEEVIPGSDVIGYSMEFNPPIRLNHRQSVFTIGFQAIHYPFANKCQYKYMLEGYDEKWNDAGTNNSATYRQLPPGTYILKVKASNPDGVWNHQEASIPIEVIPPFWKTIWAYLLYIAALAALTSAFFRFRIKQIRMLNQLQFEQKIRQKEQKIHHERLEFFTNISHELRTPLTLIECAIDDLKKMVGRSRNEKVTESLKTAGYHSSRLLELINQLLEFRSIETGTPHFSVEKISLTKWLPDYLSNFKELADSKGINLRLSMPVQPVDLWVDPDKFSMIMNNLLSNAFKYTRQSGTISVSAEEAQHQVIIEVSDSGPGISPKALPFIFERYFKTENKSTSTGIGLSLTKSLVELHQGQISVNSMPGKGSTFRLTFLKGHRHFKDNQIKVTEEKTDDKPVNHEEFNQAQENPDSRIMLIIEDNPDILTLLSGKFAAGFEVHTAEEGEKGLALAEKLIPDIIISDIMMPGIQGTEVCKKLKSNTATSHIPIILLTAKGTVADELTGLKTGADDYISKPFHFEILEARVESLIQNRISLSNYFKEKKVQPQEEVRPDKLLMDREQKFLQKAEQLILDRYLTSDAAVFKLAEDLNFSRSSLYRKIKMLTGLSINEFIRSVKIREALRLLKEEGTTVSETAYRTGFNDLKYFRETFIRQTGETPSAYKKKQKSKNSSSEKA
jgi:signal transduction histidine kinase/ligand-binding sensor domain-containing protein/DNA-binding response OmpR family regulator